MPCIIAKKNALIKIAKITFLDLNDLAIIPLYKISSQIDGISAINTNAAINSSPVFIDKRLNLEISNPVHKINFTK